MSPEPKTVLCQDESVNYRLRKQNLKDSVLNYEKSILKDVKPADLRKRVKQASKADHLWMVSPRDTPLDLSRVEA